MPETIERHSPLTAARDAVRSRPDGDSPGGGVTLSERPFRGYFNLRGDEAAIAAAVASVIAVDLPRTPNTVGVGEGITVLWLGPDEWLLVTPDEQDTDLLYVLKGALGDGFFALTDLSSAYTTIYAGGDGARRVLAKGCTLDLHPRVFGFGQCAQTVLAKADVLIQPLPGDESPGFDIVVRRSFAEYLWLWLQDAAVG